MIHVNDKLKEMKVENGQPEHNISNDKMNNENAHTVIKKKIEHRLHTNTYDYNMYLIFLHANTSITVHYS